MRNQPVVGLLQLCRNDTLYRSGSRRHICGMAAGFYIDKNRDGICNETIPAKRKTVFCSGIIIEIMKCFVKRWLMDYIFCKERIQR